MKLQIAILLCALLGLVLGRLEPPPPDHRNDLNSSYALFNATYPKDWLSPDFAGDTPPPEDPDEKIWRKAVCRGEKLLKAMVLDEIDSSVLLSWPYTQSPWDGPMHDELVKWGYNDDEELHDEYQHLCHFQDRFQNARRALEAMGVDWRSTEVGGDNECFALFHYNGPNVKLDNNGRMPAVRHQRYDADGREYRVTGGHAKIGINRRSGIVHYIDRYSAESAAAHTWGVPAEYVQSEDLPKLRSSSDLAWALWNRHRDSSSSRDPGIKAINNFIAWHIVNTDTADVIVRRILTRRGALYGMPDPWPGHDVIAGSDDDQEAEDAAALIGSPNGIGPAYFLTQHKRQLGCAKFIWKIKIWADDPRYKGEDVLEPNLTFYVDGSCTTPSWSSAKLGRSGQGREREMQRAGERRGGEDKRREFVREHVIWGRGGGGIDVGFKDGR
ncbi:hypothetical protein IQ07DRAFT_634568 [Pyrenochaeta sp. DS3sAY3a]|nr:hypothetical protein IQ07DRAFT_634568 [Pyrenochaeta sp. DS3sAY3a]